MNLRKNLDTTLLTKGLSHEGFYHHVYKPQT